MKVRADAILDDTFDNFGDEVKVGDGTITGQVIVWKAMFLMERMDNCSFILRWEAAF
jgi:hypothetical protein